MGSLCHRPLHLRTPRPKSPTCVTSQPDLIPTTTHALSNSQIASHRGAGQAPTGNGLQPVSPARTSTHALSNSQIASHPGAGQTSTGNGLQPVSPLRTTTHALSNSQIASRPRRGAGFNRQRTSARFAGPHQHTCPLKFANCVTPPAGAPSARSRPNPQLASSAGDLTQS